MSVAVERRRDRPVEVPATVESPSAKLVYLSLATAGDATVDELAARTGLGKLALLSVLGTLDGRGVVARDGGSYRLT